MWDFVIEGPEEATFRDELNKGRFLIPVESPIEPGILLEGNPFAPARVAEKNSRVVCAGAGALWSSGFVVKEGTERIIQCLRDVTERQEVGEELELVLSKIDEQAWGLCVKETRRIGVVEGLWRIRQGRRPGILGARLVKPDSAAWRPVAKPCCIAMGHLKRKPFAFT